MTITAESDSNVLWCGKTPESCGNGTAMQEVEELNDLQQC